MSGFFDRFRVPEPTRRELDRPGYEEVLGHIRGGRKIHAIKVVRERTGMGLAEAKNLAEAIAAGGWSPAGPADGQSLADRTRELLARDRVADAVLMVAKETGMTEDEASRFIGSLDR